MATQNSGTGRTASFGCGRSPGRQPATCGSLPSSGTIGKYDLAEDEFEARTLFHSPDAQEGTRRPYPADQAAVHFYPRALRTGIAGAEPLSAARYWISSYAPRAFARPFGKRPLSDCAASTLKPTPPRSLLSCARSKSGSPATLHWSRPATRRSCIVSELTREHLRKTMSFFLSISADQGPSPFPTRAPALSTRSCSLCCRSSRI